MNGLISGCLGLRLAASEASLSEVCLMHYHCITTGGAGETKAARQAGRLGREGDRDTHMHAHVHTHARACTPTHTHTHTALKTLH